MTAPENPAPATPNLIPPPIDRHPAGGERYGVPTIGRSLSDSQA
jgi:hypothetical protein